MKRPTGAFFVYHGPMKRLAPVIVLACIALAGICVVLVRGDGLPRSFAMTLTADLTSSGGSRAYKAVLDADGNVLTGSARYTTSRETTTTFDCALADGAWSSATGACEIPLSIPATRAQLASAIKEGSIAPAASCQHKQLCYDMTVR